jgi:hypothetical protein
MKITKEQLRDIYMALRLGDYFVEAQEPSGQQYEDDRDTMITAWKIIKQIEATE